VDSVHHAFYRSVFDNAAVASGPRYAGFAASAPAIGFTAGARDAAESLRGVAASVLAGNVLRGSDTSTRDSHAEGEEHQSGGRGEPVDRRVPPIKG